MSEWQPIETAPRDGTWIIGLLEYPEKEGPPAVVTRWVKAIEEWWEQTDKRTKKLISQDASGWEDCWMLKGWMPLPTMPGPPA